MIGMAESTLVNQLKTLTLRKSSATSKYDTALSEEANQKFHQERLIEAVKQQETERNDTTFSRDCLLCRKHFTGNRLNLFQHLMQDHHLFIGHPDNIVYVDEYLDVLSEKLKLLECFYCEKPFKDWMVLKEHMRKKQHKRLNPMNPAYDKFFIINYLEPGKNWRDIEEIKSFEADSDDDENCEVELMECEQENEVKCLFCEKVTKEVEDILNHMKVEHEFNFKETVAKCHLDFYAQLRLINYIRYQVSRNICPVCEELFSSSQSFFEHISSTKHSAAMPKVELWSGPTLFYFPIIENDKLIISLEDEYFQQDGGQDLVVIPEDINIPQDSVLLNEQTRQMLL